MYVHCMICLNLYLVNVYIVNVYIKVPKQIS